MAEQKTAKFCKHGIGIDFTCIDCGSERKSVHDVPWDENQQAYVWWPRRRVSPIMGDPQEPPDVKAAHVTVQQILDAHAQFGRVDWHLTKAAMGPNWPKEWEAMKPGEGIFEPNKQQND